jgi:hypothetical protein
MQRLRPYGCVPAGSDSAGRVRRLVRHQHLRGARSGAAFQGWGSKQFHSIDISWLTGFVASFVVYLALNRVMSPREPELLH